MSTPQQRGGLVLKVLPPKLPVQSSLVAWFDAAQINGVSGGGVAQWLDLSGGGWHCSQATAASQPIYQSGVCNGLPAVYFNGSSMLYGDDSGMPTGDLSMFVVARTDASIAYNTYMCIVCYGKVDVATRFVAMMYGADGSASPNAYIATQLGDSVGIANSTNAWRIFTLTRSSTTYTVLRDGGSSASKSMTTDTQLYGANGLALGISSWSPSTTKLTGYIGEVIAYKTLLATADRQRVERYLSNKWSIGI